MNKVYTITFGDVAENHARMQKIGTLAEKGYSTQQLIDTARMLTRAGVTCEIVNLDTFWTGEDEVEKASVLVIRKGVQHILGGTDELIAEHDALDMDKQALMKGRVVQKRARWNLCFAEEDQEPNYEDGKGRIVAYEHVPLTQRMRKAVACWMRDTPLNAEANYYYDISKCGIGYHGDGERRKVVAMRLGASMPIYYQWFQQSKPVGERIEIELHDGDMYVMSEKAVGFDWLKKIQPTLRHAAGCDKFVVIDK